MLKLPFLIEDFDLAKEALVHWEFDADTLEQCLSWFRTSNNAVYPFRQQGKLCFLRLAPCDARLESDMIGEQEFITWLLQNDYPVMKPVPAKDGALLLKLHTDRAPWGDYYATAFYGVAGESVEDTDFSTPVCLAYGSALGRFHQLSRAFVPKTPKRDHTLLMDQIYQWLIAYDCPQTVLAVYKKLQERFAQMPTDVQVYGLVHYDFECDNVFYDADSGSASVIDLDDSIRCWYALDVVRALNSIREEAPQAIAQRACADFITGYRQYAPLTAQMEASFGLMDALCNLYAYARLRNTLSASVENPPNWMDELTDKLQRSCRQRITALEAALQSL